MYNQQSIKFCKENGRSKVMLEKLEISQADLASAPIRNQEVDFLFI